MKQHRSRMSSSSRHTTRRTRPIQWIRRVLAQTGLLNGKTAATHHQSYDSLASRFPKVRLVRGQRFVEHDHVASAGGLTSGIDLALRVVERYLGRKAADATARYMEYRRQTA